MSEAKRYGVRYRVKTKAEKLYYENLKVAETMNNVEKLLEQGQWNDALKIATGLWRGEDAVLKNALDFARFKCNLDYAQFENGVYIKCNKLITGGNFRKIAYMIAEVEYALYGNLKDEDKVLDFITKPDKK